MGQIQNLMLIFVAVVALALFATQIYTSAVVLGNHTDSPEFPLSNQSEAFQNRTEEFRNDLVESVKKSQEADPSIPFSDQWTIAGSAIIQSLLFTLDALALMLSITTAAFLSVSVFGIPAWVLAIVITIVSLVFAWGLINAIMRYDS